MTSEGDGSLLLMNVDSLEWPVMVLAGLEGGFVVESPPELIDLVRRTARRFGDECPADPERASR